MRILAHGSFDDNIFSLDERIKEEEPFPLFPYPYYGMPNYEIIGKNFELFIVLWMTTNNIFETLTEYNGFLTEC